MLTKEQYEEWIKELKATPGKYRGSQDSLYDSEMGYTPCGVLGKILGLSNVELSSDYAYLNDWKGCPIGVESELAIEDGMVGWTFSDIAEELESEEWRKDLLSS